MDADLNITDDLVRGLLASQAPELLDGGLHHFAHGWDNESYLIEREGPAPLLVRMPRREVAAQCLINEQRCLPAIAARLPIPVPVPLVHGMPTEDYPFAWSVVPYLHGTVARDVGPAERGPAAEPLAETFVALHIEATGSPPSHATRGVPLSVRAAGIRQLITELRTDPTHQAYPWDVILQHWNSWSGAPAWPKPPVWLHGDPHPGNVLLDPLALIDFGDVTAGDPAGDLAIAWLMFEPTDRARFQARVDALGNYDAHLWTRARAWALVYALVMLRFDATGLAPIARRVLHEVADPSMTA
jgi:aminoglycoside phosphotransferase (APT) family kinase protein